MEYTPREPRSSGQALRGDFFGCRSKRCSAHCGLPLKDLAHAQCLLQVGLEAATAAPRDSDAVTLPSSPSSESSAKVGTKVRYFGDYELLEEIARGGMGVVYKARQTSLNRIVALKMILAGQLAGEEDVQRFRAEAEAAGQLDHPGIVPIFEVGEHENQHYYSMGYVDGCSLADRLKEGPLPTREAAELVRKICAAISYAHGRGVIHRDVKPGNVLLDENGEAKVTDFGLAKKRDSDSGLTNTGQPLGTPSYMPPEQAAGKLDEVGEASDVYSLGAVLYELLSGLPPFRAETPLDTMMLVLEQEPVRLRLINSRLPKDLETICLKCLEKEPKKRYESAEEFADDLTRFIRDEPILARPPGVLKRAFKWCKRRPVAATILIAAVLLGSLYTMQIRSLNQELSDQLWNNLTERAQTERLAGNRQQSLELIKKALKMQRSWELRQAAVDTIVTPQLRQLPQVPHDVMFVPERHYHTGVVPRGLRATASQATGCVALSANGRLAVLSQVKHVDKRTLLSVWDVKSASQIATLGEFHSSGFLQHNCCLSADGRLFAATPSVWGTTTELLDSTVNVWDTTSGQLVWQLSRTLSRGNSSVNELNPNNMSFSPDNKWLAANIWDRHQHPCVRVWDLELGVELDTTPVEQKQRLMLHAWSSDSTFLRTQGVDQKQAAWKLIPSPRQYKIAARSEEVKKKTTDTQVISSDWVDEKVCLAWLLA